MYNVLLHNGQCYFDERNNFETIADVLAWSWGRCGIYRIDIYAHSGMEISLHYDDDIEIYSYFDGAEWLEFSSTEITAHLTDYFK